MNDQDEPRTGLWSASRSAKEKTVIRRSVTALLDELAPERVLRRVEQLAGPVEQYRTPNGCVLQAATAAVSVSWFVQGDTDASPSELQVVVWRGHVSRRGAPKRPKGATIVDELSLRPVARTPEEIVWKATDGKEYDTPTLAAHCLALLEQQSHAEPAEA